MKVKWGRRRRGELESGRGNVKFIRSYGEGEGQVGMRVMTNIFEASAERCALLHGCCRSLLSLKNRRPMLLIKYSYRNEGDNNCSS